MKILPLIALLLFSIFSANAQSDCDGCQDYPLLPRMPNYHIQGYKEAEFDSEKFYFDSKFHIIEGKKIQFDYYHNNYTDSEFKFPSRLQLLRNYSNAIEKAGGKILFERSNSEHGYYTFATEDSKELWIKISSSINGNYYRIRIIERDEMRQDIVIDANLIKQKIEIFGKIAIYGIHFDVGEATIRKESEPSLIQIAEYLTTNPSIHCWVVGHTDYDGSFSVNSKLSLDRATAIKEELENNYNIAKDRLFAEGVGPLAPIASNKTEKGKQLNRRVELVLK